jgi:hypothetical protein
MPRLALLLFWSYAEYVSATHKFKLIESERLRPGTRIALTSGELNAYVQREAAETFPSGVRGLKLVLTNGGAVGSGFIDFGKVRRAQGNPPGWLMSRLLEGERAVEVTARIHSGSGRATVDLQSVKISGVVIEGRTLDFLIRYYLQPNYPDAKVGTPFELEHRIDRLDVKPTSVDVIIR